MVAFLSRRVTDTNQGGPGSSLQCMVAFLSRRVAVASPHGVTESPRQSGTSVFWVFDANIPWHTETDFKLENSS